MKDRIVIIGANYFQNPLILKAKELGYETHVFAWKDGSIGEKTADYFYPISIVEKDAILEECKKIKPKAVVTIASDLAAVTANYISNRLGLVCNSEYCALVSSNKYEMRKKFLQNNVAVPKFRCFAVGDSIDAISDMQYPIIVKPTDRSGSRAITKLLSPEGLESAINNAIDNSFEKKAIIEEYIEGNEFSCECISYKGKHHFLQLTQKYTTNAPHFIETGHIQPTALDETALEYVKENVFKALDALEIEYGASHTELKIDADGRIGIIEIGARMGGDCIGSDLVKLSTGYDFVKMVLDTACGKEPDFTPVCEKKVSAIKFIFTDSDVEILENIKREHPEWLYYVSDIEDRAAEEIVDSSTRRGYYILRMDSRDEACKLFGND